MSIVCARCSVEIVPGRVIFYSVVVEASADPTPVVDPDRSAEDVTAELDRAFAQLDALPASEAEDSVRRKLRFELCAPCYGEWIENPAGQ